MATLTGRITKNPDIQGGDACIRGHRIPVWVLVGYRELGGTDADLLQDYPTLIQEDLDAAWEYAAAHPDEITEAIREYEESDGPTE